MLENYPIDSHAFIDEYIEGLKSVLDRMPPDDIRTFIAYLADAYERGKRIFVIGNGGSAATASHMACDLSKTVLGKNGRSEIKRFAVTALTDNVPLITAWANDATYDLIFAEPLRNLAGQDDLLVVITGSGNSPNIVEALSAAQEIGMRTVGLLGFDGGVVKNMLDHALVVSSAHYGHIEDAHMVLTHLITAFFKRAIEIQSEQSTLDAQFKKLVEMQYK